MPILTRQIAMTLFIPAGFLTTLILFLLIVEKARDSARAEAPAFVKE